MSFTTRRKLMLLGMISMDSVTQVVDDQKELVKKVHRLAPLGVRLEESPRDGFTIHHYSELSLLVEKKYKQHLDPLLMEWKESFLNKYNDSFSHGENWVLRYRYRLCILDIDGIREKILEETRGSQYSIQRGATKMICDL